MSIFLHMLYVNRRKSLREIIGIYPDQIEFLFTLFLRLEVNLHI